jgi:hypothetical protein
MKEEERKRIDIDQSGGSSYSLETTVTRASLYSCGEEYMSFTRFVFSTLRGFFFFFFFFLFFLFSFVCRSTREQRGVSGMAKSLIEDHY